MRYYQTVKLKKVTFEEAKKAFYDFKFVKFLTRFQPVKINNWEGIGPEMVAEFELWFFGWRTMKVEHSDLRETDSELEFFDDGLILPLGLIYWRHCHRLEIHKEGVQIIDDIHFKHRNKIFEIFLYPILISPITIRKILYPMFFQFQKN